MRAREDNFLKGEIKTRVTAGGLFLMQQQQRSVCLSVISNEFKDKKPKQTSPEALIHATRLRATFSKMRAE